MFFIKFENFSAIISFNIFSVPYSLSVLGGDYNFMGTKITTEVVPQLNDALLIFLK